MRRAASVAARAPPHAHALLLLLLLAASALPSSTATPPLPLARQASSASRLPPSINLNSGGPSVGRFQADDPWVVGRTLAFTHPNTDIGGAEPQNLPTYNSHRYGIDNTTEWGYDLPVTKPGFYNCTVHFAETDADSMQSGKRVFDLAFASAAAESPKVFSNVDVFDAVGASFTAYTRTVELFPVPGILALRLYPKVGNAFLAALTCEFAAGLPSNIPIDYDTPPRLPTITQTPQPSEGPTPPVVGPTVPPPSSVNININCGGGKLGRFIADDFSWLVGGATSQWEGPLNVPAPNNTDPEDWPVIRSHRYGLRGQGFGYRIPVTDAGLYNCILHFSETDSDSFSVGARVFDVNVMNTLIEEVDVFAATGEAEFTEYRLSFTNLRLNSTLNINLTPRTGNAFISAITCVKTGDLPTKSTPLPSPSIVPSAEPESREPTDPDASPTATDIPTLSSAPEATPLIPTPSPDQDDLEASPTSAVDEEEGTPQPSGAEESDATTPPTVPPTTTTTTLAPTTTIPRASNDALLEPRDGELRADYLLEITVTGDEQQFTEPMKEALLTAFNQSSVVGGRHALIEVTELAEQVRNIVRQGVPSPQKTYSGEVQALYSQDSKTQAETNVNDEIKDGRLDERMKNLGFPNVNVELSSAGSVTPQEDPDGGTNVGAIVGGVIGGGLAVLALIAVVVFMYANRRNDEDNEGGFDGPPPDMSESEPSELARSETGGSVEFLDDDSTYTAATSRAEEHVDQVEFEKDAFGRGATTGTHGV